MRTEEAKAVKKSLKELSEDYRDLFAAVKDSPKAVQATKKLWREGNKSRLIKIGMTLVLFPEPTPISETAGACFLAAGAIQKGVRSRAIYLEDLKKDLQTTLKDVLKAKQDLKI